MTDELNTAPANTRVAPGSTGDAHVDAILALLDGLDDLPVSEHARVYAALHERLSGELNPEQKLRQAGAHGAS